MESQIAIWITAIATCITAIIAILGLIGVLTGVLPTTKAIKEIGNTIAKASVKRIIEVIVNNQENPKEAQDVVDQEVLERSTQEVLRIERR